MKYALGLDIGITSVGWAVLNVDCRRIEALGVRAFNAAETPKNGAPLAEPRRLARGARRRLRRRVGRMKRAKDLFVSYGLVTPAGLETMFQRVDDTQSPWLLSAQGLDRLLTGEEFARCLYHLAKHRGFKSNRKRELTAEGGHGKKKEDQAALDAIVSNKRLMADNGYRTAGEMVLLDPKFAERKRNTFDSYGNSIDRELCEAEVRALFAAQRNLGSAFASEQFEQEFLEVFSWQMPFAKGDAILEKVGACTFEKDEKRAPMRSPTAERFELLCALNGKLIWTVDGEKFTATPEQKQQIEELAYSLKELKWSRVRKALNLPGEARFTPLTYTTRRGGVIEEDPKCENGAFVKMTGYHTIKTACESQGIWDSTGNDCDLLDHMAFALTFYKTDADIREYLESKGAPEGAIAAASSADGFAKVKNLSLKAMRRIIPHLEDGHVYSKACELAGYDHSNQYGSGERHKKLPVINPDDIRNPVVLRALTQARKVVNAVIERYGSPWRVQIEFGRDVGRTPEDRKKLARRIEDNRQAAKEECDRFVGLFQREPKAEDRFKYRCYCEQGGKCAYSLQPIDLDRLFEPGYAEVDHIIPYSRSFDDGMANKALVLATENQNKRNRTTFEYFGGDTGRWEVFEAWVKATIRDKRKRENLLRRHFDARDSEDWKDRNLQDTRWAAREFASYVRQNLLLSDPDERVPVICLNGRITSMARGMWGFNKDREKDDLHHALDAAVVAGMTPGRIKMLTEVAQSQESYTLQKREVIDRETGEVFEIAVGGKFHLPPPWKHFRREVLARLSDDPQSRIAELKLPNYAGLTNLKAVIVSRMQIRKADGAIHKETIVAAAKAKDGKRLGVKRVRLVDLKQGDLAKLHAPETNQKLYAAIRERMEQFGYDGRRAFAEPLYKPRNDGTPGPQVKCIKLADSQPSGIEVRGGVADNGSMIRTDVFTKGGKFYLVPVYVSDVIAGRLPDRAITSGKPEDQWHVVDDNYDFLFSLQPYDFVVLGTANKEVRGYYRQCNRATASISVSAPNDNDTVMSSLGYQNARAFEKYQVDVFGGAHRVKREVRRGLENCCDIQSCQAEDQG